MSLSHSLRINFTSDTDDPVRPYSPCFIYNACDIHNRGSGHRYCESHFSETTRKVICACTTLSLLSCFATPFLAIANCYLPPIYAIVNTQPLTACVAATGISAIEATSAIFCAGSSIYCSCHHCRDQNV